MLRGASIFCAALAAGACTRSAAVDATPPAKLDTVTSTKTAIEFGDRGLAIGPIARLHAIARTPDGRIIAAGETRSAAILACFLPDGELAADFGTRGVFELPSEGSAFYDLAIDARGRIVAVGKAGSEGRSKSLVARVLANGIFDDTFGDPRDPKSGAKTRLGYVIGMGEEFLDDGFANVPPEKAIPDERFVAVAIDDRGRIVTAGSTGDRGETWLAKSKVCGLLPSALCHGSFRRSLVARWTESGELDTRFHKVGYSVGDGERKPWIKFPHDEMLAVVVLADGSVIAGGFASAEDSSTRRSLFVRYDEHGEHDDNVVLGPERAHAGGKREELHSLTVLSDAKLIAAGVSYDERGNAHAIVARHLANGAPDPAFAEAGFAVDDQTIPGDVYVRATPLASGVVLSGGTRLLRFSGSGAIDRAFKADWTRTSSAAIADVALDASGNRIDAGGNLGERAFVARVASTGCLDDPRASCER